MKLILKRRYLAPFFMRMTFYAYDYVKVIARPQDTWQALQLNK